MDFIRHAIKSKEMSATKRLHDEYRKMLKDDPCFMYYVEEHPAISNEYV